MVVGQAEEATDGAGQVDMLVAGDTVEGVLKVERADAFGAVIDEGYIDGDVAAREHIGLVTGYGCHDVLLHLAAAEGNVDAGRATN